MCAWYVWVQCHGARVESRGHCGVGSHLLPFKFRPSGLCGRSLPTRTTSVLRIGRVVRGYFQDAVESAGNQVSLDRNPKERGMKASGYGHKTRASLGNELQIWQQAKSAGRYGFGVVRDR